MRLFMRLKVTLRDHSFSTCAKFSEKLIFFTPWYAHVHKMVKHTQTIDRLLPTNFFGVLDHFVDDYVSGIRNVSFTEDFTYGLNEWFLNTCCIWEEMLYDDIMIWLYHTILRSKLISSDISTWVREDIACIIFAEFSNWKQGVQVIQVFVVCVVNFDDEHAKP